MFGLSDKGFKRKRYDDILQSMFDQAKQLFGENISLTERSPLGLFLRVIAWSLGLLWQLAEKVYNSAYVDTAEGPSLRHVGKYIGISELKEDYSRGEVVITGDPGKTRLRGFRVGTESGVMFETISDVIIGQTGVVVAPVKSVEPGRRGNVPAGTITKIINPEAGIKAVTNPERTAGGRDKETDLDFRKRYDRSVSRGGSSTVESIVATLLELPGVRDCIVQENDSNETINAVPPKSLAPVVFGGDDQEVANAIFRCKAGGIRSWGDDEVVVKDSKGHEHTIGFSRPQVVPIYVSVTLATNSHFPIDGTSQVRTEIVKHIGGEDEDNTLYNGLGLEEGVIHSRLISAIFQVKGITDVSLSIGTDPVNLDASNILIGTREVAETDWQKVVVV